MPFKDDPESLGQKALILCRLSHTSCSFQMTPLELLSGSEEHSKLIVQPSIWIHFGAAPLDEPAPQRLQVIPDQLPQFGGVRALDTDQLLDCTLSEAQVVLSCAQVLGR